MSFQSEVDFETALIQALSEKGWESQVLRNYSEADLIQNWAKILFDNNRGRDRLNNQPLTNSEMQQIIEQITSLRTPLKLNQFINGKTVCITRDNPADSEHFGKEISLKIYDRHEIAAGQSRYQIVQQPEFTASSKILRARRGDLMLLINGMPVMHIELKRSGVPVSQACNQIEKYAHEGVFSGLFSLVQVFVAMNPEETVYFANPGIDGRFNPDYYFHWADFNNEPMNSWQDIVTHFLSIPMAHQLIGFYTVADDSDGVLKVMRSYQYYAASAISDRVPKRQAQWNESGQRGGYIWHTTGSGKTMTSFKSAQLIANSRDADKVIFLMDRIELGTQSLKEYRGFADDNESVQATENTGVLVTKLKSSDPSNTLLVTSIQKMSNIKNEENGLNAHDIELINSKRIVFIVDEAHRSTFGDMMIAIKETFTKAIFFGFTGTPIQTENQKKNSTTATIFGAELHRYSIADGIRDKNVLGFDPYKVLTFKDRDVRKAVALKMANAADEAEAIADSAKKAIYYKYMNKVKMAGYRDSNGKYVKGIEDNLPIAEYQGAEHQNKVVEDILENWVTLSHNGKFHAIFATSSIVEAIEYYRLFKERQPQLKVSCLFDPNENNEQGSIFKTEGLAEIIADYNNRYEQQFSIASHALMKKDMAARLAHKDQYKMVERTPDKQLELLIVVEQMLTGFDSKWVNTLYLDKVLYYENIIQAFSRTNRLFGPDKPFGTIRYYRKPHTMEQNIEAAVKLYSGDKPLGLFVDKLEHNLNKLNEVFKDIQQLYQNAGILNFEKLPDASVERGKFVALFNKLNNYLEAARVQGFSWKKSEYEFKHGQGKPKTVVKLAMDEQTYLALLSRYKELDKPSSGEPGEIEPPFGLQGHLTSIDTGLIDTRYMNDRFDKYLKLLKQEDCPPELMEQALSDLNKSFASLSQEEQKYANIFLHDIQRGDAILEPGKSLRDYITEYQCTAKNKQITDLVNALGLSEMILRKLLSLNLTERNINEFGRYDELRNSVDKSKAKLYFEQHSNATLSVFQVNVQIDSLLRKFIISGGCDI